MPKCDPGCRCGRHKKASKTGKQCEVIDADGLCYEPIFRAKLCACYKHYMRWKRTGSFERQIAKPDNSPEALSARAKNRKRGKQLEYERMMYAICMCTHSFVEHSKGDGRMSKDKRAHCLHPGCECTKYDQAARTAIEEVTNNLKAVGFTLYINDVATCVKCFQVIKIGSWSDPWAIKRALNHSKKECPSLHKLYSTGT